MQLTTLQRFVEIVQAGSFYQASKRSGISPQAYAKTLNSLESELGVVLAKRNRTGIRLTSEGAIFNKFANDTLKEFASTMALIDGSTAIESSSLPKITIYATQYLMRLVSLHSDDYDLISRFQWREESFDKLIMRLGNPLPDDIHVAEVFSPEAFRRLDEQDIVAIPYFRTVLGVLVRSDSPIARERELSRATASGMPLCMRPEKEGNLHRHIVFRDTGLDSVIVESEGTDVLLRFVRDNPMQGCLTDSYLVHSIQRSGVDIYDLRFVPLAGKDVSSYACLLHAKGHPPTAQARRVVDLFKELPSARLSQYMKEYPTAP